jgi:cellulose synthase/poly-beta-1,6-N-acetylglucosamine synthase-like glycosyltransferase
VERGQLIFWISALVVGAYYLLLGLLAVYGAHRLFLVLNAFRTRPARTGAAPSRARVAVQLPVFNEIYVLERLVESACSLRHPVELLEVQILDDSTDETTARAYELAELWRGRGVDISCIHREVRSGFKAGALAAGLSRSRGEYIAVFDADFVPPPDFLEKSLPEFRDERVGMVQGRWGHLNRQSSLLTRAQALMLDAHFLVEHTARQNMGRLFNFNGTAGIFRRACIEDAGGWRADTLTEDLDLSYRAQMHGWRFVFREDLICPAELPVELNSLRSQQHRWAKGSIQTARRILPALLSGDYSTGTKIEALFHLTNNAAYLLLFLVSILLLPSLALRSHLGIHAPWLDFVLFALGAGGFAVFCGASQGSRRHGLLRSLVEVPLVMALGAGLALNNAIGVVEALVGLQSEFKRTPKFRIVRGAGTGSADSPARPWQGLAYRGERSMLGLVEGFLSTVFLGGIYWAAGEGLYASIPFLTLFACGYGYVALLGLMQGLSLRLHRRHLAGESMS